MPTLKTGTTFPTPEEDAAINAGIAADPDTFELTDEWFAKARRGRPPIPAEARRRRINLTLAPDVVDQLAPNENVSALVNRLLREWIEREKLG